MLHISIKHILSAFLHNACSPLVPHRLSAAHLAQHTYMTHIRQCAAVCCSVLQCVAVCCSVWQCVVVCCSVLQCVAVYRSVSQSVAECRSVSQWVALCCSVLLRVAVCCSVLQRLAACCSIVIIYSSSGSLYLQQQVQLQHTAHCTTLLHTAPHCTTPQLRC